MKALSKMKVSDTDWLAYLDYVGFSPYCKLSDYDPEQHQALKHNYECKQSLSYSVPNREITEHDWNIHIWYAYRLITVPNYKLHMGYIKSLL